MSVDGVNSDVVPRKMRDVAMVFQNYALYPHMTVAQNLGFALRLRHVPAAQRAAKVRETARMHEIPDLLDRKPEALSGGQRQRVATGRAILRTPRILLMDEPCPTWTRSCGCPCAPSCGGSTRPTAPRRSTSRTTRSKR
ncbi:MAG TPA: ATP-binding cassette domain-containing protein [Asanoa sp.]